jgi:hypothetical protein
MNRVKEKWRLKSLGRVRAFKRGPSVEKPLKNFNMRTDLSALQTNQPLAADRTRINSSDEKDAR